MFSKYLVSLKSMLILLVINCITIHTVENEIDVLLGKKSSRVTIVLIEQIEQKI